MADKVKLTSDRIARLAPPAAGEFVLWDTEVASFGVRCTASGRKTFVLMYRVKGGGREAPRKRLTIGPAGPDGLSLDKARKIAKERVGDIAAGADPNAEAKAERQREILRLGAALDRYVVRDLDRRKIASRDQVVSSLRRGFDSLKNRDISGVTRRDVAECVEKLEKQTVASVDTKLKSGRASRRIGGRAAAAQFRAYARTFLNWATDQGLLQANPLAGWRRPRATRAELVARTGRAITDDEIRRVWSAADAIAAPYGDFVRVLLLTGQRRNEVSTMRWQDVDFAQAVWTIPAGVAKNGREHRVPLPDAVKAIIDRQPRHGRVPYVFAGVGGVPISGWSKRQAALRKASGVDFKLHDLRKTYRSGLSNLDIATDLAEVMLNHRRDDLIEIYDRADRWAQRRSAAGAWSAHVERVVGPLEHPSELPPGARRLDNIPQIGHSS